MERIAKKNPIRILHIVGGMNTGGVETWLMHVLRHIDREKFQFDFLVHTTKPCFYDEEIRSFGCRIIPCMHPSRLWIYSQNFQHILKEYGPYDVVHSHVHRFSGFPLMLARHVGVPIRIAHSHTDATLSDGAARLLRKLYLYIVGWLIRRHATIGLACSDLAAANLFGKDWKRDPRWQVLYCGIDLELFTQAADSMEVRREFGISSDAFVLGHTGRFVGLKNHVFLLDIFAEVVRREPKAYLLLVGDGPLQDNIKQKAQNLGLSDRVIFAGMRSDVPRLMLGIMDVFVFPSRYEGLPLVLIEAQAAGLPIVMSDVVSTEVIVVPELIRTLSLKDDVVTWAKVVVDSVKSRQFGSKSQQLIGSSKFNITHCIAELLNMYSLGKKRQR